MPNHDLLPLLISSLPDSVNTPVIDFQLSPGFLVVTEVATVTVCLAPQLPPSSPCTPYPCPCRPSAGGGELASRNEPRNQEPGTRIRELRREILLQEIRRKLPERSVSAERFTERSISTERSVSTERSTTERSAERECTAKGATAWEIGKWVFSR